MSGPKCGAYTVETAEAREARAYAAAAVEYERTRSQLDALRREIRIARGVLGVDVVAPAALPTVGTAGVTSAEVTAAARTARAAVRELEAVLSSSVAAATERRWADQVAQVIDDRPVDTGGDRAHTTDAPGPWVARALGELAEIAAAWPVEDRREVLDRAVTAVGAAGSASGAALEVARARDEVTRLRAARRARLARDAVMADLRAQLEAVRRWGDAVELEALAAELDDPGADLDAVAARVARLGTAAHAARDRGQAAAILTDVLVEMGYLVDEGFSTRLAADGDVLAGRPEWADHAASFRLDAQGRAYLHIVRANDAPADVDERVDAQFCDEVDVLAERAGRKGLRLGEVRRFAPGTRPLREVDRARIGAVSGAGRTATPKVFAREHGR
ncbi:hypothetical protein Acsp06_62970 [Actinomycetospora sp. NBRC 106375]|uniref:hypothetical protein n=1 Tax=Actinomycetospora sp. NBRC 106375 TaxID=3032207 RepID=UPI0024A31DE8|nr:hypothetical protein [Actinomycetospora sp. NBRC 106375]GLZ50112.1 hypothetical protein Acsp06_62970 [Actinomycetospora sp. NBRC 106375]